MTNVKPTFRNNQKGIKYKAMSLIMTIRLAKTCIFLFYLKRILHDKQF